MFNVTKKYMIKRRTQKQNLIFKSIPNIQKFSVIVPQTVVPSNYPGSS